MQTTSTTLTDNVTLNNAIKERDVCALCKILVHVSTTIALLPMIHSGTLPPNISAYSFPGLSCLLKAIQQSQKISGSLERSTQLCKWICGTIGCRNGKAPKGGGRRGQNGQCETGTAPSPHLNS